MRARLALVGSAASDRPRCATTSVKPAEGAEAMTESCGDLVAFADGELDDEQAKAFRLHLAECDACGDGLVAAMQLSARLTTLRPKPGTCGSRARRGP